MKAVISNKEGKAKQIELEDAKPLMGKSIGDALKGDDLGFAGYEFEIRGGSDASGFAMRKDVQGATRKKILAYRGVGIRKPKREGARTRKNVAGNTIGDNTSQVNLYITKAGKEDIFEEKAEGQ